MLLTNEAGRHNGEQGLENAEVRKTEREMFFTALQEGIDGNRESGRTLVNDFIKVPCLWPATPVFQVVNAMPCSWERVALI